MLDALLRGSCLDVVETSLSQLWKLSVKKQEPPGPDQPERACIKSEKNDKVSLGFEKHFKGCGG